VDKGTSPFEARPRIVLKRELGGSFLALNRPNAGRKSFELLLVRRSIRIGIGSAPVARIAPSF
jgi:hypothetical protein